jgi:hypothetical protein
MRRPQLPSRRDWRDLALLALAGCLLGLLANGVHPHGINLRLAYGLGQNNAELP